ncbi:hypothetical protein [uncultured Pseudomonas sp.]|uniref:hypothetical protein n=1 Tax=uncultured Pseudomonas sp. TaxID=114707 RepID=UPI0025ECA545|nr:hypothetical protein [uncultured Pseudomonas sp.]
MDLEKIGHLLEESKGADVGFYLLLGFSCVCPGFLALFVYKPEIVENYDFSKLMLLSVSISGLCVVLYVTHIWICAYLSGLQLPIRVSMLMAVSLTTFLMVLALRAPNLRFYIVSLEFFWGMSGFIISIISGRYNRWYIRYVFNYGCFMFAMVIIGLGLEIKVKELQDLGLVPWLTRLL